MRNKRRRDDERKDAEIRGECVKRRNKKRRDEKRSD